MNRGGKGQQMSVGLPEEEQGRATISSKEGCVGVLNHGLGSWRNLVSVPDPAAHPITSVTTAGEKYYGKYLFGRG